MTRWLLIPMQPTPNGRLHIGHGAGPYLRADVIARALRRHGDQATIVTGSDAYENWVLADHIATGRTPQQTCATFHTGIGEDLDRLGIELDAWINPLDPAHRHAYHTIHDQLLTALRRDGHAEQATEQTPVGTETGRELHGVWIAGACPTCKAPAGGNTCTICGDHFSPDQLADPRSRLTDEPIRWRERSNWFAPASDPEPILAALAATGVPDRFLRPVQTYLHRPGARIRLSQPGPWGVPSPQAPPGSVLTNTYYAYSLYCAQHAADTLNAGSSLLHRESDHTVIGLFGTDNSIAGLLAPHILAAGTVYKPFDHTVVTHMLHLQGRKCSTSQQYGIWISDLIDNATITTDELRYLLAGIPLDHTVCNTDPAQITTTINELRHWHTHRLVPTAEALHHGDTPTHIDNQPIMQALHRQHRHLLPPEFDLSAAHAILHDWMHHSHTDNAATWLTGTALLAAPITPNLAREIWACLGLAGTPTMEAAERVGELHPHALTESSALGRSPVNRADIERKVRPGAR